MPYVIISIPIDELNILSTNAAHDITLPPMQTARQPYLLASADTTGPAIFDFFKQQQRKMKKNLNDYNNLIKDLNARNSKHVVLVGYVVVLINTQSIYCESIRYFLIRVYCLKMTSIALCRIGFRC